MKPEPMALATGTDTATTYQIAPEASSNGSEKCADHPLTFGPFHRATTNYIWKA
ncbi:MAG: hypothetical protein NTW52_05785 [Planctomycetota bacterium]|nr:hypothetical protein [Planctomycetota bacterium]